MLKKKFNKKEMFRSQRIKEFFNNSEVGAPRCQPSISCVSPIDSSLRTNKKKHQHLGS